MNPEIFVGIDAGSRAIKFVVLNAEGDVLARHCVSQGIAQAEIVRSEYENLMRGLEIPDDISRRIVATGYARHLIDFADQRVTEITCHAKGIHQLFPDARTIIEMGGQDSKSIRLSETGKVRDFMMNDRCAAGTGRFLEVVADRLQIPIEDFPEYVNDKDVIESPATMSSMCVVFAETEIVGLLASGVMPGRILVGVQNAVSARVVSMVGKQNVITPVVYTGGVALIDGMKNALERALGQTVLVPEHPQFTGALGAAEIARSL